MTYNDAVLWRNKYDALKQEHERTMKTLEESIKHNIKLIEISNILKINEFKDSHEYKIALIEAIIKREV